MSYSVWSKAKDLRVWADTLESRQKLPALVRKLIHATVESPKLIQFPADEGVQRKGWDGTLEAVVGNAWVPVGKSKWEMGADQNPSKKADAEYKKRTDEPSAVNLNETTFVFVTPRKWEGKTKWLEKKRAEAKWLNVLVWDCDDLEQWLEVAPAVDAWLARLLGKLVTSVRDLSSYWQNLSATSKPPLTPAVFLAGRTKAEKDLREAIAAVPAEIGISALSLAELRDFVGAVLANADAEIENASTARALVIETADAWNQLSATRNRLLLIPSDQLALEKPMVAEAIRSGHHVLTQRPYTAVRSGRGIRVPRAGRWELQEALEGAGFSETRASRLAHESGGSLCVLVRLASQFAGQATPSWSKPHEAPPLLPLVLLGSWSDRNEEDRKLVERFTGQLYGNTQQLVTRWMNQNQADAPLRLAEGIYSFVSREDSWQLLSPGLTEDLLNRYAEIAREVLGEDDPRFEMPIAERYLGAIYNKMPKFSPQLREGIAETSALMGVYGELIPQGSPDGSRWRAGMIVRELLAGATPKRWFSLAGQLPLLAEAAPDEFLSALECDLLEPTPAIAALFEKDADGFFSGSPHTSLMWALEVLAWDTTYLARVVLALAALIKLDTGGRINPRPAGVLLDIFRLWYPQTSATIDERLQVLELLSKREPSIAWTLLMGLLPARHDSASPSSKPRWRDCDYSQSQGIKNADIGRQAEWAAARLISMGHAQREKLPSLIDEFPKLPLAARNATLKWLRELDLQSVSRDEQLKIWEEMRDLVHEHHFFHDAEWALPKSTVDELQEIEQRFLPDDSVLRSKWLFTNQTRFVFGTKEMPYEECDAMRAKAQLTAVKDIFEKLGLEGLFQLGSSCDLYFSTRIGDCLAKAMVLPDCGELLPQKLLSKHNHERGIALGYAAARRVIDGPAWVLSLLLEAWSAEAAAEFALSLNFERATWEMLRHRKPDAEAFYWRRVRPWPGNVSENELEEAVTGFLKNGRPLHAIGIISYALHFHRRPNWEIVADAVELACSSPVDPEDSDLNTHSVWDLNEAMKYLQAHPTADQNRLALLEWRLLPLAGHDHFEPKLLHSELSRNAGFFAEVLAAIYRAKDHPKDEVPDQTKRNRAEAGRSLLESWIGIPGTKSDGTIDGNALKNWVAEARRLCTASGRLEICDIKIGEQLSSAPSEPDGSWPCEAVRDIFETTTTGEIIRGFNVGVFNQRGVTSRGPNDGGEQQHDLVKKYCAYAEKSRIRWPRTALALRRIADHYEIEARRQDERSEA